MGYLFLIVMREFHMEGSELWDRCAPDSCGTESFSLLKAELF